MADSLVNHYNFRLSTNHVPSACQERPAYTVIPPSAAATAQYSSAHPAANNTATFPARDIRFPNQQVKYNV